MEVSKEVGREEKTMHPVLSTQDLLGKQDETVDSETRHCNREMFIQCKRRV